MNLDKYQIEIASDVNERDGIGIIVYFENEIILEIFRDDTKRTRTVTILKQNCELELLEEFIKLFKKEIPWEFIDYNEFE